MHRIYYLFHGKAKISITTAIGSGFLRRTKTSGAGRQDPPKRLRDFTRSVQLETFTLPGTAKTKIPTDAGNFCFALSFYENFSRTLKGRLFLKGLSLILILQ